MNVRSRRRTGAIAAALLLVNVLALIPAAQVASAQTAFVTPRYIRTIGGDGRPGVFSWGVEYNPVTDEVLVSDYLNFRIRRYDLQGNHLGDFWRDDSVGQPYTIAVDPNTGAIYVAELKDNPLTVAIAKYDRFGTFLSSIPVRFSAGPRGTPPTTPQTSIRAFYTVWMTVEEDTGDLFLLDSHYNITDDYRPYVLHLGWNDPVAPSTSATVSVRNWWEIDPPDLPDPCDNPVGCVPRLYGIDITDDDVLYMSDAWNQRAYRYAKDGTWLSTFGTTQLGGDNRGVAVNEGLDRVYIVDAQNSQIDMFTLAGSYVGSFSGEGTAPGQFLGGGREIDIDEDGNLWVGDFGGFETEKFSPTGTPLLRAPDPARKPPLGFLGQPRDVAIDDQTGEVWVADAWNQRFVRFSATGAHMGTWGTRGSGGPFDMNYPRSIAIDSVSRRIWVANERGHHIQVYSYPTSATGSPTYVRQIGQIGRDDIEPNHFRWPVDIEFYTQPGGRRVAVIGDRMASSVKMYDANTYQEITRPVDPDPSDPENPLIPTANHGTAIDPATGNIYVVNPSSDRVEVYDQNGDPVNVATDTSGNPTNRFGTSGNGDGQFRDPVDAVISNDVLYVVDEAIGRIQAFSLQGAFLGKWGGSFDGGAYDFRNPAGIDADAQGRLYVTDSQNDRIQVFNPGAARNFEIQQPSVPVVSAPAQRAVLPLGPVTFTGTAADNNTVANVELMVQNLQSGLWWNATNSAWEAAVPGTQLPAIAASWTSTAAPATTVNWRSVFSGVSAGGTYLVYVRTRDASGNVSDINVRTFGMPGTSPPAPPPAPNFDTVRPNGTVSFPVRNQQLPLTTVNFVGTATDNVGVTQVRVALRDVTTGRWWSGSGSSGFSSTHRYWDAVVDAPGATSTGWSWSWTPRAPGNYRLNVQIRDAEGNIDGSPPNVPFSITGEAPDVVEPDTVINAPAEGATVPSGSVQIQGSAADDKTIAAVRVGIQDTATNLWWNGTGWVEPETTVAANLASPNSSSTNWSYVFAAPEGSYSVFARARDTSNNLDSSPATRAFNVAGAPDTSPPTTVVTAPAGNSSNPRPVTITGTATDNVGVNVVRVSIRINDGTNRWWNGTGWGTWTWVPATLTSPGGASTTWSYTFDPPAAGTYGLQVRSVDTSGNIGTPATWRNFTAT